MGDGVPRVLLHRVGGRRRGRGRAGGVPAGGTAWFAGVVLDVGEASSAGATVAEGAFTRSWVRGLATPSTLGFPLQFCLRWFLRPEQNSHTLKYSWLVVCLLLWMSSSRIGRVISNALCEGR
jgi:hypothetical protein